jgi:AcrR family transcriptional regulator
MTAVDTCTGRHDADSMLAVALASGATRDAAAAAAGVSPATVYRRLRDPEFRATIDETREELIATTTARLAGVATAAVDTLVELLSADQPAAVRLGSARTILDQTQRWRVAEEVEVRLAMLETTIQSTSSRSRRW